MVSIAKVGGEARNFAQICGNRVVGMKQQIGEDTAGAISVSKPELQVDGSDAAFRQLLHDIFSFARHLQSARAKFADFAGLSPTQYMILIAISHHDRDGGGDNADGHQ